jgi:hypothetical protein
VLVVIVSVSFAIGQGRNPANVVIDLVDGSRLSGTLAARSLPFTTAYAKIDLDIELVKRVDLATGEKDTRVLLNNGDILQGAFEFNALNVETLLGMQSIPLVLITTLTTRPSNIRAGLVLHYSFGDIRGNLVTDKSGHGHNGVVHGGTGHTGAEPPFREFDGKREFLECSDAPGLNMQDCLSILTWMKPGTWGTGQSNCVVSKKESDYGNGYVLYNDGYHPDKLNLRIKGTAGAANMLHSRSSVNIATLQHWAVTYDADTREVRLYKNGILDTLYATVTVGDMSNDVPLHIGHAQTWGGYFRGLLGNVMIYNRGLSAEEVKQIYDSQKSLMYQADDH